MLTFVKLKTFSTNTISHSWEDGSIQRRRERKTMTKNNKRNESVSKSIEYVGKIWHCIDNLGWAAYWLIADSGLVSCAGEGWKQIPCSQKTICFPNKILHPITWMNRYRWYVEEKVISNRSIWGYQVCVPVWDDIWECIMYGEEGDCSWNTYVPLPKCCLYTFSYHVSYTHQSGITTDIWYLKTP